MGDPDEVVVPYSGLVLFVICNVVFFVWFVARICDDYRVIQQHRDRMEEYEQRWRQAITAASEAARMQGQREGERGGHPSRTGPATEQELPVVVGTPIPPV